MLFDILLFISIHISSVVVVV